MNKMISIEPGFQYSVNIAYDLNSVDKIKSFIPTKASLTLLDEILSSVQKNSTERARVLIGAYGKGKSHIMLMILSILLKKDLNLFSKLIEKVKEDKILYQKLINFYNSDDKLLPVVISGSNTSLSQAFLLGLQRTLSENNLLDIMPDTNYKAAISVIERWKNEFPETYNKLKKEINMPIDKFVNKLKDFDIEVYKVFETVYPTLTSGSKFNPFLGFDIVELYESVTVALKSKGYTGIYVVYDEFSKYLESNISEASVSDTKMLQDFAEKCNRSGRTQLHIILISHKDIANYIDQLPKNKVDGWRGVSERFKHIHLNNNFVQTYEIISSVIQKNNVLWNKFCKKYEEKFENLNIRYCKHSVFLDDYMDTKNIFRKCYPLHPISMFILPRLSERVAQNERTLFTFLSAHGNSTLSSYLSKSEEGEFSLLTPDLIYDYFEPLFRKEVYSSDLHKIYFLTSKILSKLQHKSLESKIVKTIALIYILEQFERLKPTKEEIIGIFSVDYNVKDIENAIDNLIEKEYVIYLKRSNDYLKLKETSGVDIKAKIENQKEKARNTITPKEILNTINFDKYIYPYRYNDEHEMVRYFSFEFIEAREVTTDISWSLKREGIAADGVIYAILPENSEQINILKNKILETSKGIKDCIFILPKHFKNIEDIVEEYEAVRVLKEHAADDSILFDEYEVVYEDLRDVINAYIGVYTRPEEYKSEYYYNGTIKEIVRKANLTDLMSNICDNVFSKTPIINNEAINKEEPTSIALNSRNKIIAALLRNNLEKDLGFTGGGQEVSIMRSTLVRTGILQENNDLVKLNFDVEEKLANVLKIIVSFIINAKTKKNNCFQELYDKLMSPKYSIGLRKGLIPLYIAVVFHEYSENIIIKDKIGEVPLNTDTLIQINANPAGFYLEYLEWNSKKEDFIEKLEKIYKDYILDNEKMMNSYDYIVSAMERWYLSLPKYAREIKTLPNGNKIDESKIKFLSSLKKRNGVHEFIFEKIPNIFSEKNEIEDDVVVKIKDTKVFFDNLLFELKRYLINDLKDIFLKEESVENKQNMSLTSVIRDWCDKLDKTVFEQLFSDGTERCLRAFKEITNDENLFIENIAKITTGLRIEDWNKDSIEKFHGAIIMYKETAEKFHNEEVQAVETVVDSYQITFIDKDGKATIKRFERVETSNRGKLLYNAVTSQLDAMGQSISVQEKRQIIMNILKELC